MKKILSILCVMAFVTFAFVGCGEAKYANKMLESQTTFATENAQYLDTNTAIFTNDLKTEYNSLFDQITADNVEDLIQTSNISLSKLKIYLHNESFIDKTSKGDLKDVKKLVDQYYEDFSTVIKTTTSLSAVISGGGQNTKTDYEKLNAQVSAMLQSSTNACNRFLSMIKEENKVQIEYEQTAISIGSLEIIVLNSINHIVNTFSQIYLSEAQGETFLNYGVPQVNPISNICSLLNSLSDTVSSKFDINDVKFINLRSKIILLQDYNNVISSKQELLSDVLTDFDYQDFKRKVSNAYPNNTVESQITIFADSSSVILEDQCNYKFISQIISNDLIPAIATASDIIASVNM